MLDDAIDPTARGVPESRMRGKREGLHGHRQGPVSSRSRLRGLLCFGAGAHFRPAEWNGHCEDWPGDVDTRCVDFVGILCESTS